MQIFGDQEKYLDDKNDFIPQVGSGGFIIGAD